MKNQEVLTTISLPYSKKLINLSKEKSKIWKESKNTKEADKKLNKLLKNGVYNESDLKVLRELYEYECDLFITDFKGSFSDWIKENKIT